MIRNGIRYTHVRTRQTRRDVSEAWTLIILVKIFIICHLPRLILNIVEEVVMLKCTYRTLPVWFNYLISLSHFLIILSSSLSFIVYCIFTAPFKEAATAVINRFKSRPQSAQQMQMVCSTMVKSTRSTVQEDNQEDEQEDQA
ncbi:uncharacterized protein LOC111709446 [Eurytemora carolleeae]|uniref:uncharacterized protein LOC111709446 n=1 Tax=Eurytemora carolleeae TaxID=1294199 RepID=UPI000C78DC46|nr:uncharacterized protein LOC111709446 [Eurytemora carolleeae]|eukprot:XP_023338877.1 uncharacterized protein LOC111709446 [Eurytemora affinis]